MNIDGYKGYGINPTWGCEINCLYCYGPRMLRTSAAAWPNSKIQTWFEGKTYQQIMQQTEKELSSLPEYSAIMLATVCDPFQLEAGQATIPILHGLQRIGRKMRLLICTKNADQAADQRELITEIPRVEFGVTISSLNENIRQQWEPRAPPYSQRIEALKQFADMDIFTWASCEPIFGEESPIPLIHVLKNAGVKRIIFGKLNYRGHKYDAWYIKLREQIETECAKLDINYFIKKELRLLGREHWEGT